MRKQLFIFSLAIFFLSSCIKEIEFSSEEVTPRIVVNSLIRPDSTLLVNVSHSLNVLDQADIQPLTNASVKLFDGNGNFIEDLVHVGDGDFRSPSNLIPVTGNTYRINVTNSGYENVQALTAVPTPLVPVVLDTITTVIAQEDVFKVKVRIQDPSASGDHYVVRFYQVYDDYIYDNFGNIIDTVQQFDGLWFSTNSVYFEDAGEIFDTRRMQFSRDVLYNGQTIDVEFFLPMWMESTTSIYMSFSHASEEYYLFNRSYDLYQTTDGDPFAQPVQIYSNVGGGIGIFAGYYPSLIQVK